MFHGCWSHKLYSNILFKRILVIHALSPLYIKILLKKSTLHFFTRHQESDREDVANIVCIQLRDTARGEGFPLKSLHASTGQPTKYDLKQMTNQLTKNSIKIWMTTFSYTRKKNSLNHSQNRGVSSSTCYLLAWPFSLVISKLTARRNHPIKKISIFF